MNASQRRIHQAAVRLFAERGHTDLSISDLASEAGVARGTLYRHVDSIDALFEDVLRNLSAELHQANVEVMDAAGITDPARRLATAMRLLVRFVHDDPAVGRFLVRFAFTNDSLRELMAGPPMKDLATGIASGRYDIPSGREIGAASLILGATVSAMWMVLDGHQAWRDAGSDAAQLVLRALGVDAAEAADIAVAPLPD